MRFTIRDVLWLTVVAALAVGWCLDHIRLQAERDDARIFKQSEFERMELEIRADWNRLQREMWPPTYNRP